jgi:hypothetical protein
MKKYIHTSKYFYGQKISDYGLEHGYIDYATLAKAFDAVLNNDIMEKTAEIGLWEQVNGIIDNTDKIEELTEEQEKIEDILYSMIDNDQENTEEYKKLEKKYNEIKSDIQELKDAENYPPDIFQYYIISDEGANILCELTDENVFYNEDLDMYIWGVTHYGTAWDYVLTDIPVVLEA